MPSYTTYPKPDDFHPVPTFTEEWGAKRTGKARCQAWSRQAGRQCAQMVRPGQNVCKWHGGNSPRGIASPKWKDGRHSKYMPSRLLDRYREAASDGELLELRSEIALLDTRLSDLLTRVDHGESGSTWRKVRDAYNELRTGFITKDNDKVNDAFTSLDELIRRGVSDYAGWNEVQLIIEQRRKLVETERRRLVDMQQMISTEEAVNIYQALALAVKENVPDNRTLSRIQETFIRLTNRAG